MSGDDRALRAWLKEWPLAQALMRYAEFVLLQRCAFPEPILDLGCGDGLFGQFLFQGKVADGVDMDAPALTAAAARGVYRRVLQGDIHALPAAAGAYGTVFANCVLEHTERPREILAEARRVLGPGGHLVLTVPSELFTRFLFGSVALRAVGLPGLAHGYGALINRRLRHRHVYDADQWTTWLQQAGFTQITWRYYFSPACARAFDPLGVIGIPAQIWNRRTGRWRVIPKGALAARFVKSTVGSGECTRGGGLLLEARA
jgi:SAM-dependent methyltransferase